MTNKIKKTTKKAPIKVEIQEKIVDSTPEPDKFKKTPAIEKQAEKKEKAPKVEAPKVETPNKKRTEVLEKEIRDLQAKIEVNRDEIAKEIPIPSILKGSEEGFKEPSLATHERVISKTEMKRIIEAYKVSNPKKYKQKVASGELDKKLRRAR